MSQHSTRGLETSIELECCYGWITGMMTARFCSILQNLLLLSKYFNNANEDFFVSVKQYLFLEPNASPIPLNKEAAEDLRLNRENFKRNVRSSIQGGYVKNVLYDKVLR